MSTVLGVVESLCLYGLAASITLRCTYLVTRHVSHV